MYNINFFQAIWYRLKYLCRKLKNNTIYAVMLLMVTAAEITVILTVQPKITYYINNINNPLLQHIYHYVLIAVVIILVLITFLCFATPMGATKHKTAFDKIGIANKYNEIPILIYQNKKGNKVVYEYYSVGVPLSMFIKEKEFIESALDITISEIYTSNSHRIIVIEAKKGKQEAPAYVKWNDKFLPDKEHLIALGIDDDNDIYALNLNDFPHIFCGGKTGSAKTNLMTVAMYQAFKHNPENQIYLVDMKGGVDFPKNIRDSVHFIDNKMDLDEALDTICKEMEIRKQLFKELPYSNIGEYNANVEPLMPRIFVFCDEATVIFSKTKQDSDITKSIIYKLELLATQARFAGITLWLQTQRGDSDTIPPQIRSNLTKMCGKADEILSRLTIGSTIASTITDKNKGRFYDEQERGFQSFHLENKYWV